MNRRHFLQQGAAAYALATVSSHGQGRTMPGANEPSDVFPVNGILIPDDGWHLWIDEHALWADDSIHLPDTFDLATLPVNPPTGGWTTLDTRLTGPDSVLVTLPSTVEQHFWGKFGSRSYAPDEYRYAADDPTPQNGAYQGVSWWWREIEIPASMHGKRLLLQVRGARMRAEVYLNERLVGYSILEELPFECDLTLAAQPGGRNRLAIRITNPGDRYDWVDGSTIPWGNVRFYRSHGFAKQLSCVLAFTYHGQVCSLDGKLALRARTRDLRFPTGRPRSRGSLPGARQSVERFAHRTGPGRGGTSRHHGIQSRSRSAGWRRQLPLQGRRGPCSCPSCIGVQRSAAATMAR